MESEKAPVDPESLCSLKQVYHSPSPLIAAVGRNDREQGRCLHPGDTEDLHAQQGNARHPRRTVQCFTFSMWGCISCRSEAWVRWTRARCPCESVVPAREDAHSDSQQELMCTASFMDACPWTHFQMITGSPTPSTLYEGFWEILFLSYRFNKKQYGFLYM